MSFSGAGPGAPARLDGATVSGAATCVAIASDATDVRLGHMVVHGCSTAGISVAAGGRAAIANATLVGNGIGVDSAGLATIKNSLLTGNQVALAAEAQGALASDYDDLFGNATAYRGLAAGSGDLAAPVAFVDLAGHDFRLPGPQASTDRRDPADPVAAEPSPDGARINLGAFGGTAEAEFSVPSTVGGNPDAGVATASTADGAAAARPVQPVPRAQVAAVRWAAGRRAPPARPWLWRRS